ncbi:alpha/beta fold hydrolase [Streptosporangium sp. NPDC051023]|uniref:alpha/beta fold hydrolase n=1 Tax=Streptosporangium sp. NPDC051023 TaxID=3155410 RepID=UPI00344C7DEB
MTKLLLAAVLSLGGALVPQSASAIQWEKCPPDPPYPAPGDGIECGTVEVPVDWSLPDGEQIKIFASRSKARKQKLGTLVTNPGGPGNPGATPVMRAPEEFPDEILDSFDIIGFDPRGIGRSHDIQCDDTLVNKTFPPPATQAAWDELVVHNRRVGESCREKTGPLFDHLDTMSVARDVEAIRRALGAEKISFLGQSYGTLIGQHYAQLFPDKLDRLVLDGVVDHGLKTAAAQLLDGAKESERAYREYLDPAQRRTVTLLFAKADRGTLKHGTTIVTPHMLTALLNEYFGADSMKELIKNLATGKGEVPFESPYVEIMHRATWCQDFSVTTTFAQFGKAMAAAREAAPGIRHNAQSTDFVLGCQGWPAKVTNPPATPELKGVNALIATYERDLATPKAWALRVAARIPAARRVVLAATGHIIYGRHAVTDAQKCVQREISRFLITGESSGTTCGN